MKRGVVYIVSDGTGETASQITKAALVQYHGYEVNMIRCRNVRHEAQVSAIIDEAHANDGFLVFTIVTNDLRNVIQKKAEEKGVPSVDLLEPLFGGLDRYFEVSSTNRKAGILRTVDENYFKRIEAIEFTVKHDDGKELRDLDKSDIVLVGISRTSKTPLSIFLSHKGWKVSNIPLVLDVEPPQELFAVDQRKVVALTINPSNLHKIRLNRLSKLGGHVNEYADVAHIQKEIEYANSIFKKNRKWPIFDVTERALEETASEIIKVIAKRFGVSGETWIF